MTKMPLREVIVRSRTLRTPRWAICAQSASRQRAQHVGAGVGGPRVVAKHGVEHEGANEGARDFRRREIGAQIVARNTALHDGLEVAHSVGYYAARPARAARGVAHGGAQRLEPLR